MKNRVNNSLFNKQLVNASFVESFRKLDPRVMIKNPIMFTVEVVTFVMLLLFVLLPWLAPRQSKAVKVASDLTALVCAAFWVNMMMGHNTLTNVEALAGLAFLGWFIVFSRQIAAIEADRAAAQLLHAQAIEGGFEQPSSAPDQQIESRIAADR